MRSHFALVFTGLFLAACNANVPHSNPYDPSTSPSQQAKGRIIGVVDTSVLPSGGSTLTLYDSAARASTTTAGSDGAFAFDSLEPGVYSVELTEESFQPVVRSGVKVTAGAEVDLGTLTPVPWPSQGSQGVLTGVVALEGGGDVSQAEVEVERELADGTTVLVADLPVGATGTFSLSVQPGRFSVVVKHPLYLPYATSGVTVAAGLVADLGTVLLSLDPATLQGTVLAEREPDSADPSVTAPALGASITLDDGSNTSTDPTGAFSLGRLVGGAHTFRVALGGFHDLAGARPVNLTAGQTTTLADPIVLSLDRGSIAGSVFTADGGSLEGATAALAGTRHLTAVVPGSPGASEGTFRFDSLPAGSYQVVVSAPGYVAANGGTVAVTYQGLATVPRLQLVSQQGAFEIDDGIAGNLPGFAGRLDVTLLLDFQDAAALRVSDGDPTFQAGAQAYAPYAPSFPTTLSAGEGTHVVYVQVRDGAGNASGVYSRSVVVDLTAPASPQLLIEGGAPFTRSTPTLALSLSASEEPASGVDATSGLARVHLSLDGVDAQGALVNEQVFAWAADLPFLLPSGRTGDGRKDLWVRFEDGAGNLSDATLAGAHASVVVDTLPPSVATVSIDDGPKAAQPGYTDRATVAVRLSASEQNGDAVRVKLANSQGGLDSAVWAPLSSPATWLLENPGLNQQKTVWARFGDLAGNETDVSAAIYLDSTAPTASVSVQGLAGGLASAQAVTLSVAAADSDSGLASLPVQLSESPTFTGASWAALSVSPTFTLSAGDGPKTLFLRARDKAGNTVDASTRFQLDTAPPSGVAVLGTGAALQSSLALDLSVTASADATGMFVQQDAVPDCKSVSYGPFAPRQTITFTSQGAHAVYVCLKDAAGNVAPASFAGSALAAAVTLDSIAPEPGTISVQGTSADGTPYPTANTRTASRSVILTFNPTDAGEIAEVLVSRLPDLSDASWQVYLPSLSFELTGGDGAKDVYARFKDEAGNVSATAAHGAITLHAAPPSVGTLKIAGGAAATNAASVSVSLGAQDAAQMRLFVDSAPVADWVGYATSASVPLALPEGLKTVTVRFRTDTFVEGAEASASIRYDVTAPSGGALALSGSLGNSTTSSALTQTPTVVASFSGLASDAVAYQLVQATGAACSSSLFGASYLPIAASQLFPLLGADGTKTLCAVFKDDAGNVDLNAIASASIVLDTTAPTNPSFTNIAAGMTRARTAPAAGSLTVTAVSDNLGGAVTYECLGGQYDGWTACGTSPTLPAFQLKAGANLLGVRARDLAYNVSDGTLIELVQDDVAPLPPVVQSVRARADTVQLAWAPSPSGDVVGYRVNYGPSPWDTGGSGAAQGMSPVDVGNATSFVLTGLGTGAAYYVSVVAYDAAGNVSDPSEPRLVIPEKVEVRQLSSFGADTVAIGSRGAHGYLAQRLSLLQLDLSSDAAAPTTIGRANLPDLVPNGNVPPVAVPCTRSGAAGECVYLSGTTLAGEWSADPVAFHAGVSVVFFPPGGTAAAPVLGTKVASLPARALLLALSPANDVLYAADASGLKVYSLADPLAPALVASAAYPLSGTVSPSSMGRVGTTLYLLATAGNAPRIVGFDVSSPSTGLPATAYAAPLGKSGQPLDGSAIGLFGGGVYLAYKLLDYDAPSSSLNVSRYTPGSGSYPAPQATLNLHDEPWAANEDMALTAGTWAGTHAYLLGVEIPTSEQGWAVELSTLTKRSAIPPAETWPERLLVAGTATVGGSDRLLAMGGPAGIGDPNPSTIQPLRRWADQGASMSVAPSFFDARGEIFAFSDHYVFVTTAYGLSAGERIWTVDVSNPLLPRTVSLYSSSRANYLRFLVHGGLLYAQAGDAIEIFRIAADGSLSLLSSVAVSASSLAVSGRYLFAGLGASGSGVRVWNVATPAAPALVTTGGSFPVYALDVRGSTVFAAGETRLQSLSFNGSALSDLSAAATLPTALYTGFPAFLSVRGQTAVVSDFQGAQVFDLPIAQSAAPAFEAQYSVTGPVLQQAGYLVGMAPYYSNEAGLSFQAVGSPTLDGSVPFGSCRVFYPSLASSSGVYYASCRPNGVFIGTAVDPMGGKILKDVNFPWQVSTGPLAHDGSFAFMGGSEMVGANAAGRSFYDDEHLLAGGGSQEAVVKTAVAPQGLMGQLSYRDGTLFSCEKTTFTQRSLVAYDVAAPISGWPVRGSLLLLDANNSAGCVGALSQDGRTLYAAIENDSWEPYENSLRAIDVRNPASPVQLGQVVAASRTAYRGTALYRQKLFVSQVPLDYPPTSSAQVDVFDVATPAAPSALASVVASGAPRTLYDLAIAGDYLFVTGAIADGPGPYLLQVWRLGPAHDGTGATLVGTYSSLLPLTNPVVAGDTLFVRLSSGIATFDLTPLYQSGAMPTYLASQGITQTQIRGEGQLSVDGPFARLLVAYTYRVFDLR